MKLICFDLDNTLINSEKAHVDSYNFALKKHGFKPWPFNKLVKLFGRPHDEVIQIITKRKDKNLLKKISKDKVSYLIKHSYKYAKIIPGTKQALKKLKKGFNLAIISNTSHKSVIALLKGSNLPKSYFKVIIGNDDAPHSKPYPDEILKAEKLVHHKADFMVGDSPYDILAGKKAKVKTISVLTGRYSKAELKKYKPDYILKNIKFLPKTVLED